MKKLKIKFEDKSKNWNIWEKKSEIESPLELSMEKSDLNFQLKEFLMNDLISGGLVDLFEKLEMPLLKVLTLMESNGIKINSKFF